jgi:hypothetical protein
MAWRGDLPVKDFREYKASKEQQATDSPHPAQHQIPLVPDQKPSQWKLD